MRDPMAAMADVYKFLGLPPHAFDHFVFDRLSDADGAQRIYLRPKVPFGA